MSKLEETMYELAEKNVCASCSEHDDCAWVIRGLQSKCTYLNDVMYGYELCQQDMAKLVVDVEVANVGILQMGNLPKTEYTEKDIEEIKALKEKIDSSTETKPAEWSEEDERICKGIKELIPKCMTAQGYNRYYNWLKNLHNRIHAQAKWKPSEEQMDALKNSAYGTYQNGDGPALRELYEQLKKL